MGFGAHVCYHCRISPPRFLAECRKRRLNQGSLVFLYFNLSALFDLYLVFARLFSCTALFVSISQVIGCEDCLRNDLYCVGWGVKLCSTSVSYVDVFACNNSSFMIFCVVLIFLCCNMYLVVNFCFCNTLFCLRLFDCSFLYYVIPPLIELACVM